MEKKSVYMICISVIAGFIILGLFIFYGLINLQNVQRDELQYQMVTHGDSIIVFDQKTGDYWQKFLPQNDGPTEWKEFSIPTK